LNIDRKSVRDQCVLSSKLFASLSLARSAIISFSHLISTRHAVVISLPRSRFPLRVRIGSGSPTATLGTRHCHDAG